MFEQAFKNIDDVLRKEAGCSSELDYTEQTSWLLFLKYLDALEHLPLPASRTDMRAISPARVYICATQTSLDQTKSLLSGNN